MDSSKLKKEFEVAYDEHADAVFRRCFFKVSDREIAKDITQESFVRLWDYYSRGDKIQNPKALVFRIANNLIIDHYRKKESDSLDEFMESGFEPEVDTHKDIRDKTDKSFALKIIMELPDDYREAVTLRYVEEMGPKEIAELLGESENTISVRIHRGIKKIKEILEENETEF